MKSIFLKVNCIFVALLHFYFMVLEMFLWTSPKGLAVFDQTLEAAQSSATLAANQGLYNGFLAVGLLGSYWIDAYRGGIVLRRFILACVVVAGVFGGLTVAGKVFFIQACPALLALCVSFYIEKTAR